MTTEWREHPPAHHLVAAYLDYKPAAAPAAKTGEQVVQELSEVLPIGPAGPCIDDTAWSNRVQASAP